MTDSWRQKFAEWFKIDKKDVRPLFSGDSNIKKEGEPLKKEFLKTEEKTLKDNINTSPDKESVETEKIFNLLNGKMPSGKDCLGCKIIATTAPLGICAYLIQYYRKQNWKALCVPTYRIAAKSVYISSILGCLWLSVLSATGAWLPKRKDESFQEYFERDKENQRQIGGKIWTYMKNFSSKSE